MELLKTREINGILVPKEKRYMEVTFECDNIKIDCGFLDYKERIELAEHLQGVVDDLLYDLEDETE